MSTNEPCISTSTSTGFFDLPFEIRTIIYPQIFKNSRVIYDFCRRPPKIRHYEEDPAYLQVSDKHQNAFLQASKQCYTESIQAYFIMSQVIIDPAFIVTSAMLERLSQLRSHARRLEIYYFRPKTSKVWRAFGSLEQLIIVEDVSMMRESQRVAYLDGRDVFVESEEVLHALSDFALERYYRRHGKNSRYQDLAGWLPKEVDIRIKRRHMFRHRREFNTDSGVRCHIHVWERSIEYNVRSQKIIGGPPRRNYYYD